MVRKDGGFIKHQRIDEIRKMIAKNIKEGVKLEKLLTIIEAQIGLTRERALAYVNIVLETSDSWNLDESTGMIYDASFTTETGKAGSV